jgi:hypothetical protein
MRIAHRLALIPLAALTLAAPAQTKPSAAVSIETLRQNFLNPPDDAKPMMRWWWFGTAVEKPEILRELEQMKADGIGGVELAFVYPMTLDDPANGLVNHPFLSPEMLDRVRYAQSEARKLGLRVDVTLCSGWPYGGPATKLEQAATRLRTAEIPLPADAKTLPQIKLAEGESIISTSIVEGEPKHWNAASALNLGAPGPDSGTWDSLPIPPSAKRRTALFFIQSHTLQQVKRAAVGAEGYVLDPLSHDAVAAHLKAVGEPLVNAFGSTPPYAIFSDSLEVYGADWTPTLPAEFKKRRGYDLLPHLPELVAGGTPEAERVRHDWGQTLTELVNQNYLTQINNWAIDHNTKFRSQTYGTPAVDLSSQSLVALPEGEGPRWREFSTLRWATSANHLFGNNVTSAETFTWLHSPVFRATPLDMKAEADLHFLIGVNQIIGHGWPFSPPQAGEPGWSLYAAAVFNDHNPWQPVMPDVTRYIRRISYLLRQGEPANQVAILLPTDDAWANFAPGKVTVTGEMARLISPALMSAILSAGYNVDFIDAKTINHRGTIEPYQILVIPPTQRIPIQTLHEIYGFAGSGGKVIAVGNLPTTDPDGHSSDELTRLIKPILLVPDTDGLEKALGRVGDPDLQLTNTDSASRKVVGFIRRKLPTADVYFVANTSNHPVQATVTFDTTHRDGEQWNPDTGEATAVTASNHSLYLAPYESRIFVFTLYRGEEEPPAAPSSSAPSTIDLSKDWHLQFSSLNKSETQASLVDWTANPTTLHYSGEGIYSRDFIFDSAPKSPIFLEIEGGTPTTPQPLTQTESPSGIPNPLITRPGPGMRAWYDPPIREAAIVYIDGQRAGSLWHPPYRLEVTKFLKPGQNHIEIRVYNTAINAWSAQPPRDFSPLIDKFGDRFQMQDLDKVKPVPSGILGQIHLVTGPIQ